MTTPEATPRTSAGRAVAILLAGVYETGEFGRGNWHRATELANEDILAIERETVLDLKERDAAASVFLEARRETKFESVTHQAAELMRSGVPEDAAFFWAGAIGEGVRSAADLSVARALLTALALRSGPLSVIDHTDCMCATHKAARAFLAAQPEPQG